MGERIEMDVMNTIYDAGQALVNAYMDTRDFSSFSIDLMRIMAIEAPFDEKHFARAKSEQLADEVYEATLQAFQRRAKTIAERANPILQQVYAEAGDRYDHIAIPLTDGRLQYQIRCPLRQAAESNGESIITEFMKVLVLHHIDEAWKEHLREMDELRHSVQNASYENKDPLLIYKLESYELFRNMLEEMNRKTVSVLMRIGINAPDPSQQPNIDQAPVPRPQYRPTYTESRSEAETTNKQPIRSDIKVGRNDPCPCGSGRKFKQCHGSHL